jgi:hypothetical protein
MKASSADQSPSGQQLKRPQPPLAEGLVFEARIRFLRCPARLKLEARSALVQAVQRARIGGFAGFDINS